MRTHPLASNPTRTDFGARPCHVPKSNPQYAPTQGTRQVDSAWAQRNGYLRAEGEPGNREPTGPTLLAAFLFLSI